VRTTKESWVVRKEGAAIPMTLLTSPIADLKKGILSSRPLARMLLPVKSTWVARPLTADLNLSTSSICLCLRFKPTPKEYLIRALESSSLNSA
jgi:hypothetical protein